MFLLLSGAALTGASQRQFETMHGTNKSSDFDSVYIYGALRKAAKSFLSGNRGFALGGGAKERWDFVGCRQNQVIDDESTTDISGARTMTFDPNTTTTTMRLTELAAQ